MKVQFSRALPSLFIENAALLKLGPDTPAKGVQVQNYDYGEFDVNIADIWVEVRLSESPPEEAERHRVKEALYDVLASWFISQGLIPKGLVLDIFWGPTNGKGVVDGVEISW